MKLQQHPLEGAQPRDHVLRVLREKGVSIEAYGERPDWYLVTDLDDTPEVIKLTDPVRSQMIVWLWRRFGELHEFSFKDLQAPRPAAN